MHFSPFPGSCAGGILSSFSYFPDEDGKPNKYGTKPSLYLKEDPVILKKFQTLLEKETKKLANDYSHGITLAITADYQNNCGLVKIFIDLGWIPLVEGFNNPNHDSTCTLWAYITKPKKLKTIRMKGSSRKKINEVVRSLFVGE